MSNYDSSVPDGYKLVSRKRKIYPHLTRDYRPVTPYLKKTSAETATKQAALTHRKPESMRSNKREETDAERSIRKTKATVKDYALSNIFDLFVTFTFKDNRYDLENCNQRIRNWLKNQKKRTGSFEYLVVPEYHKDGAIHVHGLLKNYKGSLSLGDSPKARREKIYNFDSYTLGFTTAKKIIQDAESFSKVSSYITKYITKDMPRLFGRNRFFASHGLQKPTEIDNPEILDYPPYHQFPVDNGILYYYKSEEAPDE